MRPSRVMAVGSPGAQHEEVVAVELRVGMPDVYLALAGACPRTSTRRFAGCDSPPARARPTPSSWSARCTSTATASPKTPSKRSAGCAWRPSGASARRRLLLGSLYHAGVVVPPDDVEAVRCYRLAAEQGSAAALVRLGFMHANGEGVAADPDEAVRCWQPRGRPGQRRRGGGGRRGRSGRSRAARLLFSAGIG